MWAMSALKSSEVLVNGPEDRQSSVHLQRPARGHRDPGQLGGQRSRLLPEDGGGGEYSPLSVSLQEPTLLQPGPVSAGGLLLWGSHRWVAGEMTEMAAGRSGPGLWWW